MRLTSTVEPETTNKPKLASRGYRVQVARSISEVHALRSVWEGMQWHPNSDVDNFLTVLSSRPEFLLPNVMVVYRDATPEAMLVGRLEERAVDTRVGYLRLPSPKVKSLTFIYGGLLGDLSPEGGRVLVREILRSLGSGEARMAYFNALRADTALYRSLADVKRFPRRDYFPVSRTHRASTLPDTTEEFYRRLSPKVRKNQRWQARRILEDFGGDVEIVCFREPADLDRMRADVEAVARTTYQRGIGVGFVDGADMRGRLQFSAESGRLRAFVLYLSGRPAAFWIGTVYGQTFHSDCMGYDSQYARNSPGMFLIMKVIERFCDHQGGDHLSAIDFGLGDAQYKRVLGNKEWQDVTLYLYAPDFRGMALSLAGNSIAGADRTARKAAERLRIVSKIKKEWRSSLRERQVRQHERTGA